GPDGNPARANASLEIAGLPALRLQVVDTVDPLEVGGKTAYKITVTNQGTLAANQVQLRADVPPQMHIVQASGPVLGPVTGNRVSFPALESLPAGQTASYLIEAEASEKGDAVFRAELESAQLKEPLVAEESTTIYASAGGANVQNDSPTNTDDKSTLGSGLS